MKDIGKTYSVCWRKVNKYGGKKFLISLWRAPLFLWDSVTSSEGFKKYYPSRIIFLCGKEKDLRLRNQNLFFKFLETFFDNSKETGKFGILP